MKLPWSTSEYEPLSRSDLEGPATLEKRVRVAATMATMARDANMQGRVPVCNMETIRLVLTMSEDQWQEALPELRSVLQHSPGYDTEDGRKRFRQTIQAQARGAEE